MLKDIKTIAYEKYKLDWLIQHNHTLPEYIQEIASYYREDEDLCVSLEDSAFAWENEKGFNGEIWVCKDEFLDNEYEDEDYMEYLLDEDEFILYLKDMEE